VSSTSCYHPLLRSHLYTGQADPFEGSHGGIPHDRTRVGTGVIAIGVANDGNISFLNKGMPIVKADDLPNPSYLTILERNPTRLCVVSELVKGNWKSFDVYFDGDTELVSATPVGSKCDTRGSYPCHITNASLPTEAGTMECIFISNYGEEEGVLSVFCSEGGVYTEQAQISFGAGSKADLVRQQSSHAHSSVVSSISAKLVELYAADLGSDSIIQFAAICNPQGPGVVECVEKGRLAAPSASGPRSLAFNPNPLLSNIAVVSLEMTAQVWLIRRRMHDGCLEGVSRPISLLPVNWPIQEGTEIQFNRGRWASDAVWSPDGKYVYAAARLHDSISVFSIQYQNDRYRTSAVIVQGLKLVQRISTQGVTPRCLGMSGCGEFLLVCHQHSHDVSSFQRNGDDGTLTFVNKLDVNCAACVKLVRADTVV